MYADNDLEFLDYEETMLENHQLIWMPSNSKRCFWRKLKSDIRFYTVA